MRGVRLLKTPVGAALASAAMTASLVGGVAWVAADGQTIYGCVENASGRLRIVTASGLCKTAKEREISWNQVGPPGPAGPQGEPGIQGSQGPQGPPGPAATEAQLMVIAPTKEGYVLTACSQSQAEWQPLMNYGCYPEDDFQGALRLDTSRYPTGATFRLEVSVGVARNHVLCARLFNGTTRQGVVGSELCQGPHTEENPYIKYYRVRSLPMLLSSGMHEYIVELKYPTVNNTLVGYLYSARVIVEWS